MTTYMFILVIFTIVVVIAALGYTLSVTKEQKKLKGELDTPIPGKVQENIYTRNPVFLAVLSFGAIVLLLIIFSALRW